MGVPDTLENRARFTANHPVRAPGGAQRRRRRLYLASDVAQFVTGVVLGVDGGRTI